MSQNIKVNAIVTWEKRHLSTVGMWLLWLSKSASVRKHFHLQQNGTEKKTKHFNWQWIVFSVWNSSQLDPNCEQAFFSFLLTVRYYLLEQFVGGGSSIKVLAALPSDDLLGLLFLFNVVLFIVCVFLAALGLWCCAPAFSGCGEQGLLFPVMHRLVFVADSLAAELVLLGTQAH